MSAAVPVPRDRPVARAAFDRQLRGSLVHAALEQLYGLPAVGAARTRPDARGSRLGPGDRQAARPGRRSGSRSADPTARGGRALLSGYYRLEDPTRFDPESCEQRVEVEFADGTLLRASSTGCDVAATGELRVVDYKTGKAPPAARAAANFKAEVKAMFQMKFYAVALYRSRGVLAARLRLLPRRRTVLDYSPDLDELLRFEKTLMAIWHAIQSAGATGDFRPNPSRCATGAPPAHCPVRRHAAAVSGLAGASGRLVQRRHFLQHRGDELADRGVNVHRARQRGVGSLGRHDVENAVDNLVTADSEDRRPQDLFGSASTTTFIKPCVSPFSTALPTLVIGRLPSSARRPDERTWSTVIPARPSGGSM